MKIDAAAVLWGWLKVEIEGPHPERLLNLALSQDLPLYDLQWQKNGRLRVGLSPEQWWELRSLAELVGCRARIVSARGLPFLLHAAKKRPLLPVAALLFIPLLAWACSLVDEIAVTCPEPLPETEQQLILELAAEAGITPGRSRWQLDLEAAEKYIVRGFPQLFFTEIKVHGNDLEIAVARRTEVPEGEHIRPPGDVVATAPGVIVDLLVQRGTAQASPGDTVRAGQVLISGDYAGEYLGAVGIVTARIYGEGYGESYLQEVQVRETGRFFQQLWLRPLQKDSRSLLLLGRRDAYLLSSRKVARCPLCLALPWRKIQLPVELIWIEVQEEDPVRITRSPEQAQTLAREQALSRAEAKLQASGAQLLSDPELTCTDIDLQDGLLRAHVTGSALADIGGFTERDEAYQNRVLSARRLEETAEDVSQ